MIYTEEDLEQAYAMGYNEAVDDVNAYIEQDSTEFSLDESYDEDYSAVEAAIMNETKSWKKKEHNKAMVNELSRIKNKTDYHLELSPTEKKHKAHIDAACNDAIRDHNVNLAIGNERANKNLTLHPGRYDRGKRLRKMALAKFPNKKEIIDKCFD